MSLVAAGHRSTFVTTMLAESIEAIRALRNGGYVTYRGKHTTGEDARIFSMPDERPGLAVAASGNESIELAVEHLAGMVGPDADRYMRTAGKGHRIGQVALSYDKDEGRAREFAMHSSSDFRDGRSCPSYPGLSTSMLPPRT
jgi:alkanesulfonate monooxygenase SsuD/methylene tetrahydromethanopterin reductase-like flavin-dependent oxidoreductase (luciferase family)